MLTLTTEETAAVLDITPAGVRKLVGRGKLQPVRPGAKPLHFREDDVWRLSLDRLDPTERDRRRNLATRWAGLTGAGSDDVSR